MAIDANTCEEAQEPNKKCSSVENILIAEQIEIKEGADFETAISATKFGIFNLILFSLAFPSCLTPQMETTSMAFVLPLAQCDLNLSLRAKGILNSMMYIGMCISGLVVGFMGDVLGRRRILAYGYLIHACVTLLTTFAPSFAVLLVAKFLGGLVINGPSSTLPTYLSEFHAKRYRSRVPLSVGVLYCFANVFLPLMAWVILPLGIKIELFGGNFVFHAWNLFLLLATIPALTAGFSYLFLMPETPKFLMTKGKNEEALEVFERIYAKNTGNPRESYPVTKLIDERDPNKEKKKGFRNALNQIGPLFRRPHLTRLILVCVIMFFLLMTLNSFRLWLPHIFQSVNDYESSSGSVSFCGMMEQIQGTTDEGNSCSVNFDNSSVYVNMIIVALVTMSGYLGTGTIINKLGKKTILCSAAISAGLGAIAIYFAPNITVALALICLNSTCNSVCIDVTITVVIDLFPTSLRASAVTLCLLCGRFGSVLGSIIFPFLLSTGCAATFFALGAALILVGLLSLLLPNTDLKNLE